MSHDTVEQLITKFEESLSPLRTNTMKANDFNSPIKGLSGLYHEEVKNYSSKNEHGVNQSEKDQEIRLLKLEL